MATEQLNQTRPQKALKYQRLADHRKELSRIYKEKVTSLLMEGKTMSEIDQIDELTNNLSEDYSICELFEASGILHYETIAKFCKEKGFLRVFDIGCAHGHQSEVFLNEGLEYVVINQHKTSYWNDDIFSYITGRYPLLLETREGDLGVSVLSLTWNCYLQEKQKTLAEQCEALCRDFKHCLIYTQNDHVEFVSRYFKKTEHIQGNFYYYSN